MAKIRIEDLPESIRISKDEMKKVLGGAIDKSNQLRSAAENWLAITGVKDSPVEQFSQPVHQPQMPTLPSLKG